MTILITGATGLVGRQLVPLLQSRGHIIHFLTTSAQKVNSIQGAKGFLWNPEKGHIDPSSLRDVDAVVHLAGASIGQRWSDSYKKEIVTSRVSSADVIYRSLSSMQHRVTHFISASGIGIYPDSLSQHYDENFKGDPHGFVADVVRQWEKSADAFELLGIQVSKVRTGLVLSKAGGALEQLIRPIRYGLGAPLGSGKQIVSWIHVEDLARIYALIVEKHLSGVFNAVAPSPVSQAELTRQIAKTLNKPLWLPAVPAIVLRAALGEMASLLTQGQYVENAKISRLGMDFSFPEVGSALRDLLA